MSKFYTLALALAFTAGTAMAQADRYWVGTTGSNWSTSSNWSLTAGGGGGAGAPTSLQNAIFDGFVGTVNFDAASITINSLRVINNADLTLSNPVATAKTISVNDGLSTNQDLRVDATSKLTLTTGSGISVNFTVAPFGALVDGTIILKGGSTPSSSGGRVDASNASAASPFEFNGLIELQEASSNPVGTNFKFNTGSSYIIRKNGGSVPNGVWSSGALIEYRGGQTVATSSAPFLAGPPAAGFGRFVWNVSNQSGTLNLALSSNTTFNGDFTVSNTNGQILRLATTLNNAVIKGNLNIQGSSIVNMTNSASTPASGTSLTVEGNLNISSGTLDLQESASGASSLLKLWGSLTVSAGATLNTSATGLSTNELELNGTAQQTLNVAGSISGQTRIKINNSAGIVSTADLTLPASTNSRLTLTTGNINMGSNLLFIQNPSTTALAGGTVSSHIIGKLRRATNTAAVAYLFPVSNSATELASVKVYPADAASNQFQAEFFRPNTYPRNGASLPSGIAGISNYYWDLTRPSGSSAADLQFVYGGLANNGGITATGDVRVLHWTGSAPWENLGGTDAGGNAVDVAGVTSFSPFALGSVTQSLPARLISFSGYRQNNINILKWETATEQNSKGFYIERSADGSNFTDVGFVASRSQSGNSNTTLGYQFTDNQAAGPLQYYRLRQADFNGRETRSAIIVINGKAPAGLTIITASPNPVKNITNVMISLPAREVITINIYDSQGKIVKTQQASMYEGTNTAEVNLSNLQPGTYIMHATGAISRKGSVMLLLKQ
jgi:uncharacterized protein YaiE (UPF0345 family)